MPEFDQDTTKRVKALLGTYPHVVTCSECCRYVVAHSDGTASDIILASTLTHHESSHSHDPLTLATEHFSADFSATY